MARQRGFTLLEILVAVAILGTALVSLLGLHARNLRLISETQDLTSAAFLASRRVAEIKSGGFPELGETEGDFREAFELAEFGEDKDEQAEVEADERFRWRSEVEATLVPTLRVVVVRVGLREDEHDLVRLSFIVAQNGVLP